MSESGTREQAEVGAGRGGSIVVSAAREAVSKNSRELS